MKNGLSALKRAFAFAFAFGISSLVAPANAAPDLSHCTDNSRECLVASAIVAIALGPWPDTFPVWFAVAVLGRDSLLAIGFFILPNSTQILTVHPSFLGKIATALQIIVILWVLLGIRSISTIYPAGLAAFFTLVSGGAYLLDAVRQVQSTGRRT